LPYGARQALGEGIAATGLRVLGIDVRLVKLCLLAAFALVMLFSAGC
jgi:hypothetical protein